MERIRHCPGSEGAPLAAPGHLPAACPEELSPKILERISSKEIRGSSKLLPSVFFIRNLTRFD
jgi:hypothetical protein